MRHFARTPFANAFFPLALLICASNCSGRDPVADPTSPAPTAVRDASLPSVARLPTPPLPTALAPSPQGSRDGGSAPFVEAPDSHCPEEMAPIPGGGCIDRFEASAGKGALGNSKGHGTTLVPISARGRLPITNISEPQAERACQNAHKHLCSLKEWTTACYNTTARPRNPVDYYAYGRGYEERRCNDWHASDKGKLGVVRTGSFPRCVTPRGVYDLANNAAELTSTASVNGTYAAMGGSYMNVVLDSNCDEDEYTLRGEGTSRDIGFRCCSEGK